MQAVGQKSSTGIGRAWRAVQAFERQRSGLESLVYALSGRRIPVVASVGAHGASSTDGEKIYMTPPIRMGDELQHSKAVCGVRLQSGELQCRACRSHEEILVMIFHELGHNVFKTFGTLGDFRSMHQDQFVKLLQIGGGDFSNTVRHLHGSTDMFRVMKHFSPYGPFMLNVMEDIRIDTRMFTERPGYQIMRMNMNKTVFSKGIETENGYTHWNEAPASAQSSIALLLMGMEQEDLITTLHPEVQEACKDPVVIEIMDSSRSSKTAYHSAVLAARAIRRLQELNLLDRVEKKEEENTDEEKEGKHAGADRSADGEPGVEPEEDPSDAGGTDGDVPSPGGGESEDPGTGDETEEHGGDEQDPSEPEGGSHERESEPDLDAESDGSGRPDSGPGSEPEPEPEPEPGADPDGDDDESSVEGPESEPDGSDVSSEGPGDGSSPGTGLGGSDAPGSSGDASSAEEALGAGGESPGGQGVEPGDSDACSPGASDDPNPIAGTGTPGGGGGQAAPATPPLEAGGAADMEAVIQKMLGHAGDGYRDCEVTEDDLTHASTKDLNKLGFDSRSEYLALKSAISQANDFDAPSEVIDGALLLKADALNSFTNPANSAGIDIPRRRHGRSTVQDLEVPESILGSALLKLRVAFAENDRSKHTAHLKSGKINTGVLGKRAPLGDPRLFRKKMRPNKRDYAVLLSIDVSGSTGSGTVLLDEKRALAAQATLLDRLGVKFAVLAHTGDSTATMEFAALFFEIKNFNEPWSKTQKERLANVKPLGGNIDGHSLEYLRKYVMAEKAEQRIIMYYTDGEMPYANYVEELRILRKEIEFCKKNGIVLFGIGIETDSPSAHGLPTVVVNSDSDLINVVEHTKKALLKA